MPQEHGRARVIFQFPSAGGLIVYVTDPPDELAPEELDGKEGEAALMEEEDARTLVIRVPVTIDKPPKSGKA